MVNQKAFEAWVKYHYRVIGFGKLFNHGYGGMVYARSRPTTGAEVQMMWEAYVAGIECERKRQQEKHTSAAQSSSGQLETKSLATHSQKHFHI